MSDDDIDVFHFDSDKPNFEDFAQKNGINYWFARDLMVWLGYKDYKTFKTGPIQKAITVCLNADMNTTENFQEYSREINGETCPDFKLTKCACFLIAMNGDRNKSKVACAQVFFAKLAEEVYKHIGEAQQIERIPIRKDISAQEKSLSRAAKDHGIQYYGLFRDKGYRGLYNMSTKELRIRKQISEKQSPLDFMETEEMAANLFVTTQAEGKIRKEDLFGQIACEEAIFSVGKQVRKTIVEINGTLPENQPK